MRDKYVCISRPGRKKKEREKRVWYDNMRINVCSGKAVGGGNDGSGGGGDGGQL